MSEQNWSAVRAIAIAALIGALIVIAGLYQTAEDCAADADSLISLIAPVCKTR